MSRNLLINSNGAHKQFHITCVLRLWPSGTVTDVLNVRFFHLAIAVSQFPQSDPFALVLRLLIVQHALSAITPVPRGPVVGAINAPISIQQSQTNSVQLTDRLTDATMSPSLTRDNLCLEMSRRRRCCERDDLLMTAQSKPVRTNTTLTRYLLQYSGIDSPRRRRTLIVQSYFPDGANM